MAEVQVQPPVKTDIGPNQQVYTTGYVSDSQKPKLVPPGQVFSRKVYGYAEQVHITDVHKADLKKGHPITILGGDLKNEAGEYLIPLHLNGATVQAKDGDWVVNEEGVSKVYSDKEFHKLFAADTLPVAVKPVGDQLPPVKEPLAAPHTPAPVSSAFDHPVQNSWETDNVHPAHVDNPAADPVKPAAPTSQLPNTPTENKI